MSIRVRRYEPADIPAIDRLNSRFEAGEITHRVWTETETTPAESRGDPISHELYVAVDESEVRGGVWIHEHQFVHRGETFRAGWLKYPVAESLINRDFGGIPGAMIMSVMRRQPELMALGMGQRDAPFAMLLETIRWSLIDVPFYVAPVRLGNLAKLPQLRRNRLLAAALDIAAATGLASLGSVPFNIVRRLRSAGRLRGVGVSVEPTFGEWSDQLWERCRTKYGFMARRDSTMLNYIYSDDFTTLRRLRVKRDGVDIGWIAVTISPPGSRSSSYFLGDVRVGFIADAVADPEDAATMLAAATRYLVDEGADVLATNQLHPAWRAPLRSLGFLQRPTTFFWACSPKLKKRIDAQALTDDVYINRGDCDGPHRW